MANILLINGLPDAPSDRAVGKLTLATRLSPRGLAVLYTGLMLAAHLWLAVGVWALIPPLSAIWGLLSLPLGLVASVLLWLRAGKPQRLRPVLALTIATASVHGLAMAAGLLSMRWTG